MGVTGRAIALGGAVVPAILLGLSGATTPTALLAVLGGVLGLLASIAVGRMVAAGLRRGTATVTGTTARDLDLTFRDLLGNRGNLGLLGGLGMATAARAVAGTLLARTGTGFGGALRLQGRRILTGCGAGALGGGTERVVALLGRQVAATATRRVHAAPARGVLALLLRRGLLLAALLDRRALAAATG